MKRIIAAIILLVVISSLIFIIIANQKQRLAPDPPGTVSASGTIEVTEVDISPKLSGQIIRLTHSLGEHVDSGELLAEIDVKELRARRAEIEAGFELIKNQIYQSEIQLNNLNRNLIRLADALAAGAATQSQHDDLVTQRDLVKQQIRVLESQKLSLLAQQSTLETQIANSLIYAPLSGHVTAKNFEEGELAMPGLPLYTLSVLDQAHINVYIREARLGLIRLGDSAHVTIDAYPNQRFLGYINFISPEAEFTPKNIQTREERVKLVFEVRIQLFNPEHKLKPGLPADVIIFTQQRNDR